MGGRVVTEWDHDAGRIAVFRYADGSLGEVACTFVAVAGQNML